MYSTKNKLVKVEEYTQLLSQLGNLLYTSNEIQIDSRQVSSGDIFCAYPGGSVDGRSFISNVTSKSPSVILYENPYDIDKDICSFGIKNLQQYVGVLAANKHDNPSQKMLTIGVTGTNGKTSISHWLNQAFNQINYKTAIIGTTGCGIYPDVVDLSATTPNPVTLQKLFTDFHEQKVNLVAMEVSSHALHQGRVNGVHFDSAIFTNLTQDHLDYHGTFEEYFKAKEQLFYWQGLKHAVINIDDEYGSKLYNSLVNDNNKELKIFSCGIDNQADIQAQNIKLTLNGMTFDLVFDNQTVSIQTKVIGLFNVYNLLAVFATLIAHNVSLAEIQVIAKNLTPVVGRMDAIIKPNQPLVVVDYAHTPDALEKALSTLKEIPHDKLYCVFGCGGNRDKTKRPLMGNVSFNYADFSYVTSDNPRSENPKDIIEEIVANANNQASFTQIENRKDAIVQALANAKSNDIVLIAGKGHETYQEIEGVKHHFSDFEIVNDYYDGKK